MRDDLATIVFLAALVAASSTALLLVNYFGHWSAGAGHHNLAGALVRAGLLACAGGVGLAVVVRQRRRR